MTISKTYLGSSSAYLLQQRLAIKLTTECERRKVIGNSAGYMQGYLTKQIRMLSILVNKVQEQSGETIANLIMEAAYQDCLMGMYEAAWCWLSSEQGDLCKSLDRHYGLWDTDLKDYNPMYGLILDHPEAVFAAAHYLVGDICEEDAAEYCGEAYALAVDSARQVTSARIPNAEWTNVKPVVF